jgi:hypothetical protein
MGLATRRLPGINAVRGDQDAAAAKTLTGPFRLALLSAEPSLLARGLQRAVRKPARKRVSSVTHDLHTWHCPTVAQAVVTPQEVP